MSTLLFLCLIALFAPVVITISGWVARLLVGTLILVVTLAVLGAMV